MTRRQRFFACVLVLFIFGSPLPSLAEAVPQETQAEIEQLIAGLREKTQVPGVSLAIATDNQVRFSRSFGWADLEHRVPVTAETRFRTASIAKSMTAVLVLSLMEAGKLDLDAEVQDYCSDFPEKRWPVTCRHLLSHLGGVRHYKSRGETLLTKHYFGLKSALQIFADDRLRHEPGTKFLYSTFGYNLLGAVAEGAGDKRFFKLLEENVLEPAGMDSTVADDQAAIIPGRTRGYIRATPKLLDRLPENHNLKAGQIYNAPLHDTSMKIPGGGLLSTPTDLVRFAIACNTGKLLKPKTCSLMWTRQKTDEGEEIQYGLGWRVGRRSGRKMVYHTGGQAGTSTVLVLFPDTGVSVSIMCNLQHVALRDTAIAIANLFQSPAEPMDYSPAIEKLKAAVRHEVQSKNLPAFSISLVDDDKLVWAEGFGYQDAKKTQPATAETIYRVGSVSKLFTDIAIMQLAEDGELDLDAPVTKYLPGFQPKNPYGIPLTLRQMMSHQSGLVRESPVGNYFDPEEPTLAETAARLNDTALVYKPETRTKYSNAAVAVVGAVLESRLDESHPDYVHKKILDPLAMNSSRFEPNPEWQNRQATGWMRTYDGRRFEAPEFQLGTGPAGNLYSSVRDLSKFLTCLFREGQTTKGDSRIFSAETLKQMTTPVKDAQGKPLGFGLGFHIQDLDGNKQIGHGGAVYGFSTQLEALPERKLGVAAASSLDGTNGIVRRLTDYALRLMIAVQDGKPLPEYPMSGPVPPQRGRDLVGTYREVGGDRFTRIREHNGRFFIRWGVYRRELATDARDGRLVMDDEFGSRRDIELTNDTLVIDGAKFQRLEDEPPAEIPKRWQGLIGEYGWDHNTLYILEDRGRLYALIEWFYYYPLKEVDRNTFEFPDYGLYHGEGLKFRRDKEGIARNVIAAEVKFPRRDIGTRDGETFKIEPVKPIDELRTGALKATPPREPGDFRKPDLVELTTLDPTIKRDIRYATTNNFTGAVFYKIPRAFMQRPAARAVVRANKRLKDYGLGLLVHDAYRPWFVTKMFWDATPENLKDFVADPAKGSRHNRGCAVDLTLYNLSTGEPIQMVAGYDEFSPRSFPLYPGGTSRKRWHRDLLRRVMEAEDFTIYEYEWWHFDYQDWKKYRIGNLTFEEIQTNDR